jgi:outer membrane immunogenic protein
MAVMKKFLLSTIGLAALVVTPALSADMPVKYNAPPPAASWTGFYAGADLGLRATSSQWSLSSFGTQVVTPAGPSPVIPAPTNVLATDVPMNGSGGRVGGYFGYNWQVAPRWVWGLEANFGWGDKKVTQSGFAFIGLINGLPAGADISVKTTWDASVRARLGVLATPTTMLYVTGGPAWQHVEANQQCLASAPLGICSGSPEFNPFAFSNSVTLPGLTFGGGMETTIAPNWTVRAEYRYATFRSTGLAGTFSTQVVPANPVTVLLSPASDIAVRTSNVSFGLAHKFGGGGFLSDAGPMAAAFEPAGSWTGIHVGAAAGFRASRADVSTISASSNGVPLDLTGNPASNPIDGIAGRFGGYVGYDRQVGPRWVVGVEGDLGFGRQTTALNGTAFTPGLAPLAFDFAGDKLSITTGWDASARGRLGFLVTPNVLAYVTGGAAWQHYEVTSTCEEVLTGGGCILGTPQFISQSLTKVGGTVGGGVEARLARNWLARGEYRYADFGTGSFQFMRTGLINVVDSFAVRLRTHTALFGIAYEFSNGPITAKY